MKSQMKPPLIVRVALQCRVFVQIADRVAHCVHVLAGDVRLLRIVLEIFLNHIGMLVHAGFEIGLIDQVDAVLIAQIVPTLLVRIVRGADGVLVSVRRLDTTNFLR